MREKEEWKCIPHYDGAYEISNMGRVRSLTRTRIVNNCHGGRSLRTDTGRIMSLGDNGNGYAYVSLSKNGNRRNHYVHRLVADAFLGKPEAGNFVVDHIDHDRRNNAASNLQWVTQNENVCRSKHLMRHVKSNCKRSSTGEKYITKYGHGYRVAIKWAKKSRQFKNLEDAVAFRNEVILGAE